MSAARLSPAASLLRNSKLFSLPPTLTLPPQEASSETIASSDTATTPYPIRAAIETPRLSLNRGDWGLKRSLPLKTTTKTGTPVIRVQRGLDTPEHTVDFESAADHVLNLQKWQQLHMPVQYPSPVGPSYDETKVHGVFNHTRDNTTNISNETWTGIWPSISPEDRALRVPKSTHDEGVEFMRSKTEEAELTGRQPPVNHERRAPAIQAVKRWRYDGPWLAGMTGMEFNEFLEKKVRKRRKEFRGRVEAQWYLDREAAARAKALEEGTLEESSSLHKDTIEERQAQPEVSVSVKRLPPMDEEDYQKYLRALRRRPQIFGPLIAEFLDLPDGPKRPLTERTRNAVWEYGRDTVASSDYSNTGPPRTHPSAGLAYSRSRNFAMNDGTYGPQKNATPVVGRVLKTFRSGSGTSAHLGVAGFVTPPLNKDTLGGNGYFSAHASKSGGQKVLVVPSVAMVNVEGMLDLHVRAAPGTHVLENDEAVRQEARKIPDTLSYTKQVPRLDKDYTDYKKAEPLPSGFDQAKATSRSNANEEDPAKVLDMLNRLNAESN